MRCPSRHGARRIPHDGTCSYCHRAFGTLVAYKGRSVPLRLEFDHFVPWAGGRSGRAAAENLVAACHLCNRVKGSLTFSSFAEARLYVLTEVRRKGWTTVQAVEPAPRVTRTCERCQGAFVSGHANARFCSSECRFAVWTEDHPRVKRKRKPAQRGAWQGPLLADGTRTAAQSEKLRARVANMRLARLDRLAQVLSITSHCQECASREREILALVMEANALWDRNDSCPEESVQVFRGDLIDEAFAVGQKDLYGFFWKGIIPIP